MSLHLWEAVHEADVRSDPLFDINPALARLPMVIGLANGLESLAFLAHVAHVDVMLERPASASEVA